MAPKLRAKARPKAKGVAKARGKAKAKASGGRSLPRSAGSVSPASGLVGQGKLLKDGGDVYDIDLNVSDASKNMNKFYRMQVVESNDKSKYWFVQHWGRTGTGGQVQVKGPSSKDVAVKLMKAKFRQKTGKAFEDRGSTGPGSGDSSGRKGHGTYEMTARLRAAKAGFSKVRGSIQISLMWHHDTRAKRNDLDLHVICPSREEIFFCHKKSRCGGVLDVDRRQDAPKPVENIVWKKNAPRGKYEVKVKNFSASHQAPIPFEVAVVKDGGVMKVFKKKCGAVGRKVAVTSFNY